jgi:uncharacterized protein
MSEAPSVYDFIRCADQGVALSMLKAHPDLVRAKASNGETALHHHVIENRFDAVRFLIQQGADVNSQSDSGDSPLMDAAGLNYVGMCSFLIRQGANVHMRNIESETALHRAARAGAVVIVGMLLEAGADIHARDSLGESILDVAFDPAWPDIRTKLVRFLAQGGYDEASI